MAANLFGKMKYRDGSWSGYAALPRFAEYGSRPEEPEVTGEETVQIIADMERTVEKTKDVLRSKFGPAVEGLFAALNQELTRVEAKAVECDPRVEERERKRQERAKKKADRLARGKFPIGVADPDESGPRPEQAASLRRLTDDEPAILKAVLRQVWKSFREFYGEEHWRTIAEIKPARSMEELRGRFAITMVQIARQQRDGFAHLIFEIDSDWQDERGLLVVYSPDTKSAAWTSYDELSELVPPEEGADEEEDYAPTPHDELVEAVLNGEEDRARRLAAAGADINALARDEFPPLCMAVEELDVDKVRRLLAFGADPELADPMDRDTPLKLARRLYRDMGFAASCKDDDLLQAMMMLARESAGKDFGDMKKRLEAIISLLEGRTRK